MIYYTNFTVSVNFKVITFVKAGTFFSFIGNENIHLLSKSGHNELRVELETFDGSKAFAEYKTFSISDESSNYKLTVFGYSGTAGDVSISILRFDLCSYVTQLRLGGGAFTNTFNTATFYIYIYACPIQ